MKKIAFLLFLLLVLNTSSSFSDIMPYLSNYTPVFMKRADLIRSVSYQSKGRELVNPGKIYYKTPYIFVNERYKGIHVINNTNPAHPVKEGFIVAPGCIDMAVKGDVIYLDNSVDLVAFSLLTKKVTSREVNVFPEPLAPDNSFYYAPRDEDMVVVDWKKNTNE